MGPTFLGEWFAGCTGPEEDLQSGNVSGLVCASASVCLQRDTAGESVSVWGLLCFVSCLTMQNPKLIVPKVSLHLVEFRCKFAMHVEYADVGLT